ncbi:hypothetical protein MARINON1_40181 [Marinobacter salarius]|nr:hypothetical protein MBHK15_70043 [Marinobacter salarius]VXB20729.1 hypothetical protein MARINON1_40181 [Marinobacter salarius]
MGQVFSSFQQGAALFQQIAPGWGEGCSVAGAVEDGDVEVFFEFLDGVADCRRDAEEFVGGAGKAAFAVDGIEDFEGVYGDGCVHVRII